MDADVKIWEYKNIYVEYFVHLDGDGRSMAKLFVDLIKQKYADRLPFDCCYEWCSGPGFIGFAMLAENICKRLVLADINPDAVSLVKRTIERNDLEDCVTVYHSDNLKSIPQDERFDLVVSNPPNYYCLNPLHPSYSYLAGDLRPNDPEWKIHKDFYQNIGSFLNDEAVLCIEEVDPFATKCYTPNIGDARPLFGPEPFDIRPREPIYDFQEMIAKGGLMFDETVLLPEPSLPVHVLISHFSKNIDSSRLIIQPKMLFLEQVGELENGSFRLYAMQEGNIRGYVDLPDDRLWLISLIELLISSGIDGMTHKELCSNLNIELGYIESAADMLKNMGWAY